MCAVHRAHDMNAEHQPEVRQVDLGESLVTQNPRVAHEDIHLAPAVDGPRHHLFNPGQVLDNRVVAECLASETGDLAADLGGSIGIEVIDHYPGAVLSQRQSVRPAQSFAAAGYDGDSIAE